MNADARWMDLFIEQQRYSDLDKAREDLTLAAMLTGEECSIFGRRVRIRLEWLEDQPMTDEQLREMGERMKVAAVAKSEAISAEMRVR